MKAEWRFDVGHDMQGLTRLTTKLRSELVRQIMASVPHMLQTVSSDA